MLDHCTADLFFYASHLRGFVLAHSLSELILLLFFYFWLELLVCCCCLYKLWTGGIRQSKKYPLAFSYLLDIGWIHSLNERDIWTASSIFISTEKLTEKWSCILSTVWPKKHWMDLMHWAFHKHIICILSCSGFHESFLISGVPPTETCFFYFLYGLRSCTKNKHNSY